MNIIVDAHEDISWNTLTFGRDCMLSVAEKRAREVGAEFIADVGHAMLGWPEWMSAGIAVIFATLFAAPIRWKEGDWETQCYRDSEEAYHLYRASLEVYKRLLEKHGDKFDLIRSQKDLHSTLARWEGDPPADPKIGLVLLMEGADGIRDPEAVAEWYDEGVRIIGPSWEGTRYAGGPREPGPLTDDGRALLEVMADLGMILDLAHMPEESALESIDRYEGTIAVTHTSPLALVPHSEKPERHMRDPLIRLVADRGGVIGMLLANHFLKDGWDIPDGRQAVTIEDVVIAIDHVCQVVGDARHVGLGSDFDGGFGLNKAPSGLDSIADLRLIGDALRARGYGQDDVDAILAQNWLNTLYTALPES
jgi:membrane dipeptidase